MLLYPIIFPMLFSTVAVVCEEKSNHYSIIITFVHITKLFTNVVTNFSTVYSH